MKEIITHTPITVWGLAIFLFITGYQSCFLRKRHIARLLIIPCVFLYFEANNIHEIFGITPIHLLWSFVGITTGILLGVAITRRLSIRADHKKLLVELPGDWVIFFLIIMNFCFQYALHSSFYIKPSFVGQFANLILVTMGIFSGISIGRNSTFFAKYLKSYSVEIT